MHFRFRYTTRETNIFLYYRCAVFPVRNFERDSRRDFNRYSLGQRKSVSRAKSGFKFSNLNRDFHFIFDRIYLKSFEFPFFVLLVKDNMLRQEEGLFLTLILLSDTKLIFCNGNSSIKLKV
jgi:hypothetical protein